MLSHLYNFKRGTDKMLNYQEIRKLMESSFQKAIAIESAEQTICESTTNYLKGYIPWIKTMREKGLPNKHVATADENKLHDDLGEIAHHHIERALKSNDPKDGEAATIAIHRFNRWRDDHKKSTSKRTSVPSKSRLLHPVGDTSKPGNASGHSSHIVDWAREQKKSLGLTESVTSLANHKKKKEDADLVRRTEDGEHEACFNVEPHHLRRLANITKSDHLHKLADDIEEVNSKIGSGEHPVRGQGELFHKMKSIHERMHAKDEHGNSIHNTLAGLNHPSTTSAKYFEDN